MESLDLTKMVQTSEENANAEQTLDLPEETNTDNEAPKKKEKVVKTEIFDIYLASVSKWFEENSKNFDNVKRIKATLMGVDPNDSLLFSVKSPKGGVDETGEEKRELFLFKNSKNMVVPNVPVISFDVYSNGFKSVYNFENSIIKCYVLKTSLIMVYCAQYDNKLLPFLKDRISKNCKGYNVNRAVLDEDEMNSKLSQDADVEALHIKYPQMRKESDKIKTNLDAVNWILERENGVYDVNHLLQLDDLIIDIMK